jgi:hypothetical protein
MRGRVRAFPDSRWRHGGYNATAFLCTSMASIGAFLTVWHLGVLCALLCAGIACLRASFADDAREFTAARHHVGSQAADRRAVDIQLNTARQLLHVGLA